MLDHSSLNRRAKQLHEPRELSLTLKTGLVRDDVVSDLVFERPRQFQMLDRRIDLSELGLELCRLGVQLADEHGQLAENIGVDDRTEEKAYAGDCHLERTSGSAVIACGQKDGGM